MDNRNNPNRQRQNQRPQPNQPRRRLSEEEIAYRKKMAAAARRREEIEKKRRKELEKKRRKARLREGIRIFFGRFLVFLVILVILLAVFGLVFMLFFYSAPNKPEENGKMDYYFGGAKVRSVDIEDATVDGRVYFCFNDLAEYLGLYESGGAGALKFVLSNSVEASDTAEGDGNEEIVVFYTDVWHVTINGQDITLDIPNVLRGEEVWVSVKFVDDYMENISIHTDLDKAEVKIARIKDEENSDKHTTVYLPVTFKLKWSEEIENVDEDPLIGDVTYTDDENAPDGAIDLEFKTDLSDYEMYMNPTGDMRDAFLTLVNTKNTLTENDIPDDLMDVKYTSSARQTQQLREYAAKALEALFQEMHAEGFYNMAVYSGFRTYSYQAMLFENYTNNEMASNPNLTREQAEAIVLTYSTRPGTSEHQTGLAVDMDTLGTFSTTFEYEAEYKWLSENAWKFGFILRFPKDKTDITTIQFEPWHYRYVGRYHAQKILASGLCLEEYIEQLG